MDGRPNRTDSSARGLTSAVRRLLPAPLDAVDLLDAYATPLTAVADRPYVRVNMVSSLDGAISVQGRAGGLGSDADRRLFRVLRSLADVVVVGAGTARVERYGPVKLDESLVSSRRGRGQPDFPPIAIVTRSCQLDWDSPIFTETLVRPIVITVTEALEGAAHANNVADVIIAGDHGVDLSSALGALYRRGFGSVVCEGGPMLNGRMAEAGTVDELCLTVAPLLVQGDGPRIFDAPALTNPHVWVTEQLLEEDGSFFFRLRKEQR